MQRKTTTGETVTVQRLPSCDKVHQDHRTQEFYAALWQPLHPSPAPLRIPDVAHGLAPMLYAEPTPPVMLSPEDYAFVAARADEKCTYVPTQV